MCGRYNLVTDAQALVEFFDVARLLAEPDDIRPRYNIAPGQDAPIVRMGEDGRELLMARWGLVPRWSEQPKTRYATINARAETVADKPAYRDAFRHRRCLVPATGFYEWKQQGKDKQPWHVTVPGHGLFAFAGLWERWEREAPGFDSFTIIVTDASPQMQALHDRMPVILNKAQYNSWLNPVRYDRARLQAMLVPWQGALESWPVSRKVNNPRNDTPDCLQRYRL